MDLNNEAATKPQNITENQIEDDVTDNTQLEQIRHSVEKDAKYGRKSNQIIVRDENQISQFTKTTDPVAFDNKIEKDGSRDPTDQDYKSS